MILISTCKYPSFSKASFQIHNNFSDGMSAKKKGFRFMVGPKSLFSHFVHYQYLLINNHAMPHTECLKQGQSQIPLSL